MKDYWLVVADDDVFCLKNIKQILDEEKIRASIVRSGTALLKFLENNEPDLILLDVMMPEMSGFETLCRIRENEVKENRRQIPVIFMTGENDTESEYKALELGASDFIRKPTERSVLLMRIQNTISKNKTIENLTEEAVTDHLTGLYNRAGAESRVAEFCQNGGGMLLIVDLDNFKPINDIYGHDAGDRVLKLFAELATKNCRSDDLICRIGGDEFLVFLKSAINEKAVAAFSQRMNRQLIEECRKAIGDDFNVPIGVSIGCVPVRAGSDYQEIFEIADKALYKVKQEGKHGYIFSDPDSYEENDEEKDLDSHIDRMLMLCEERSSGANAMIVGQEAFVWVYRFVKRFAKRHNNAVTILIFSLGGENYEGKEYREQADEEFQKILQMKIRSGDVVTNKANLFFAIFPELENQNVHIVIERINNEWEKTEYSKNFKIEYRVRNKNYKTSENK